jgi:3-oxoacyl-[acyl-carrier protein] reductase
VTTTAAIVTGAGRGIGRAIALGLAEEVTSTLCISRTATCEETSRDIRARAGDATGLSLDLADHEEAGRAVRAWLEQAACDRHLVVLAAAELGPRGPLGASPLAGWERTFQVNVLGNLAVLEAALERMLVTRYGRIVFLAGGGAAYEYPVFPAYAATKTALVRIVENLAVDLRDRGDFSVVCLAPGAVETDLLAEVRRAGADVRTPGRAEDAVEFVRSFLASPAEGLSGRFVHVRDDWEARALDGPESADLWKLRRVE